MINAALANKTTTVYESIFNVVFSLNLEKPLWVSFRPEQCIPIGVDVYIVSSQDERSSRNRWSLYESTGVVAIAIASRSLHLELPPPGGHAALANAHQEANPVGR